MASASVQDASSVSQPLNVLGQPLEKCSDSPPTGFFRSVLALPRYLPGRESDQRPPVMDIAAQANRSDRGRHTLAGVVSDAFLEFSASQGNDLATPHPPFFPGLTEGCRWCLCVSRWKEALLAYRAGDIRRDAVPRVVLGATDSSALGTVSLGDLREFAFVDSRGER
ncbi:hypothetical protein BDV93DRAFT_604564 [Ceratobasidium sp. AG-I]|nr:hypothetical protein BDV93DRAFT_604564 [Ceratobasidium sp. AG-I]